MGHGRGIATHAEGSGGRQVYEDMDKYGNIYDHFAIAYQWESGTRGYHFPVSKTVRLAVTRWNSTDRRAFVRLKTGTPFWLETMHGVTVARTTTCTKPNTIRF